jgi:hypothetical protein
MAQLRTLDKYNASFLVLQGRNQKSLISAAKSQSSDLECSVGHSDSLTTYSYYITSEKVLWRVCEAAGNHHVRIGTVGETRTPTFFCFISA